MFYADISKGSTFSASALKMSIKSVTSYQAEMKYLEEA